MQLLSSAGADATGDTQIVPMPSRHNGNASNFFTLFVYGTFSSATVKLQISPDNSEWFDVTDADNITAKTAINVEFRCRYIRAVTVGGTSPDINAVLL